MKRLIKITIWLVSIIILAVIVTSAYLYYFWSSNLPYIGELEEYNPPIITEIYSDEGIVIGRFWEEKRVVITLDQVSEHLIQAFVAAEDDRFFKHQGVDFLSIFRAFLKNIQAGRIEQGGSTITQQVTRSLLLKNTEKTFRRKAREAILSLQIEKSFSKEKILYLYMNQIYLGHGAYGVEAAARTYFGKKASELNIAESALLAGLPQAPSRYSPYTHFDRARSRQKYVLERMREEGYITPEQEKEALTKEIKIIDEEEQVFLRAPYFTEHVRRYLEHEYGRDILYRGGLKVYTTMRLELQRDAQSAIEKGLRELDKREGYRGPLRHLNPEEAENYKIKKVKDFSDHPLNENDIAEGIVEEVNDEKKHVVVRLGNQKSLLPLSEMKWARTPNPDVPYYEASVKKPGDVLRKGDLILCTIKERLLESPYDWLVSLEQEPVVQSSLLCLETNSGRIRSMVGGRDFSISQFNRANQAKRQPGSAFKPIIYAAALDYGMTPSTVIIDAPFISNMDPEEDEEVWKPRNYHEKFFGPTLFREALIKSRNVITVKILKTIGVNNVIDYARRMGIESELNANLSLALGSSGMSLLEITSAYSIFANGGRLYEPFFINRIEDRSGKILEENQPHMEEVIDEDTAFVMTDILEAVITEGTGWRARALNRPAAGKTGTTNDLRDAWFMGYTPDLVTGVWVGYDDRVPMGSGETGSRAASPIWLYFMKDAHEGEPVQDFIAPESVVFAKIDSEKGLLGSSYSKKTVFQAFKKGTEPKEYTPKPEAAKSDQFLQFDMDFE